MSYRGPGLPLHDLRLGSRTSFRTISAFPVPAWHIDPMSLGAAPTQGWTSLSKLNLKPGTFVRTERAFPVKTSLLPREAYAFGLGDTASALDIADARLATDAGIPVPVLRAIRSVESGASPAAVRFEPHLWWRTKLGMSAGSTGPQIAARIPAGGQSQVPYTPGSTRAASAVASETNRAAFNRAFAISPTIAVQSTSWGSYQVLGNRLLPMFSNDAQRAVQAFDANPAQVSERLLVSWMNASPIARVYARSLDFANFAHRYNGCAMPCDLYAGRLQAAYNAALPAWRAVQAQVENATGTATPAPWPTWAPWAIGGGAGALGLGAVGLGVWLYMRHRRRS